MALPNIYEGNYSKLIILPLVLVLISIIIILIISPIKYGIDLKGGTLITLQLSGAADETAVKDALVSISQGSASVKTYNNPTGQIMEIEMATDERIGSIDEKLELFDKKIVEVETLEVLIVGLKSQYSSDPKQQTADELKQAEENYTKGMIDLQAYAKSIESSANSIGVTDKLVETNDARALKNSVTQISLEAKDLYKSKLMSALSGVVQYSSYSVEEISPTLSKLFIDKVISMAFFSVLLAFAVILLIFKQPLPCLIVLSGATADIVMAMGAMGLFGIPLSLTSFAALMMMAGLSLDTDMMLTIKTLQRTEGTPRDRAYDAFKTGFAMSSTILAGFGVLFILGVITRIQAYYTIGAIGVIGLIGDVIMTWGFNAVLALWYAEGKFPKLFKK